MDSVDDQLSLERGLCERIDRAPDGEALVSLMGEILRSLLRRKGDGEFLGLIQDAFIEGIAGRGLDDQKALARQVVGVVLAKRPEIAIAWRALNGEPEPAPARRRAADHVEEMPAGLPPPRAVRPAKPSFAHDRAEALVAEFVADVFERRLSIFRVADPAFPSTAYRHEQPFFLFNPAFAPIARDFLMDVVMVECRDSLERHLYKHIDPLVESNDEGLKAFMEEKRPQAWKILTERLTKLAGHHRTAEAKLAAPRDGEAAAPEFCEVEVPVSRPRVFRVLGVEFVLGERTISRKMRVRVKASTELDRDELHALNLITLLRDLAADEGIDLPPTCDFLFLSTILEFDARKYAQNLKELRALAAHEETSRAYLSERLNAVEENYSNYLADAMVLILFTELADAGFGFKETYDICIGTANTSSAMASQRPFLYAEIGRRPRELAFQVREGLRRRYDERTVGQAVRMLLAAWSVMSRTRFAAETEAALTVLGAFPVAFAGDPDEEVFSHIGHILHRALNAKDMDVRATVDAVVDAYTPVARKLRSAMRTT